MKLAIKARPKVKAEKETLLKMFKEIHTARREGRMRGSEAKEQVERFTRESGYEDERPETGEYEIVRDGESRWHDPAQARRKTKKGEPSRKAVQKAHDRIVATPPSSYELGMIASDEDLRMRKRLQDLHDGLTLCVTHVPGFDPKESKYFPEYDYLSQKLVNKLLTTQSGGASTGTGGDFIPNTLSGQMTELFRLETILSGLIPHINMPTSPFRLPLEGADVNAYYVTEASDENVGSHSADAISTRTPATSQTTFSAKKLAVRAMISDESDEDAIISTVEYSRRKLVTALANSHEDCLINGDSTSTHQDSDVTTATDHRKAWNGFRYLTNAEAKISAGFGKLTAGKILSVLIKFGKFAARPSDSAVVVSPVGMLHLAGDANVYTVDKFGPQATILTGQFASILGRPVILSGYVRDDLNASGVYDNSTTDRGMALVFHRPSWGVGDRRSVTVESARDIITGKFIVVVTARNDFQRMQAETSGNRNVGFVYNIDTTATF